MTGTFLKIGSAGDDVRALQQILRVEGFYRGEIDGIFGPKTEAGLVYFQQTHLDADGTWLVPDGIAGPKTWWALEHPSGEPQRSNIEAPIPRGLSEARATFLEVPLHEWAIGVREIPNGSNAGDRPEGGVDKYTGGRPMPWCMRFVRWCWARGVEKGALEGALLESLHGGASCYRTAVAAQEISEEVSRRHIWHDADGLYVPRPGDAFVMLYRKANGRLTFRGHTGFVLRIETRDGRAVAINTLEGNCGNRVKLGHRPLGAGSSVEGFINLFEDADVSMEFELGTVAAGDVARDGTR